jgi:hypothetical protein
MFTAADNALLIDLDFVSRSKRYDFITNFYRQFRKILAATLAPLEACTFEQTELLHLFDVGLKVRKIAAQGAIDAMLRNNNPTFEFETFTEGALPYHNSFRIFDWHEFVVQDDLLHRYIIP